jgi:hypothetical protein
MAGTVIVDTINSSVAGTPPVFQAGGTQIGTLCRAWVNFNGTGTVAIRASFNVSSITDNGTGNYTVNFTTAMPDANYEVSASASPDAGTNSIVCNIFSSTGTAYSAPSTSAFLIGTYTRSAGTAADPSSVCVSVFR